MEMQEVIQETKVTLTFDKEDLAELFKEFDELDDEKYPKTLELAQLIYHHTK